MRSSSLSGCSVWPLLLLSSFSTSKISSMCVFIFMTIMANMIIKLIIIITNIFINSCLWWTATLSTWTQWRSFTPHHAMPALKKGPSLVQGSTHFSLFKIFSINTDGLSLYSECNKFSWSPWPKKFFCLNYFIAEIFCRRSDLFPYSRPDVDPTDDPYPPFRPSYTIASLWEFIFKSPMLLRWPLDRPQLIYWILQNWRR